ncbi:MAG: M48 family metallopeptidase [Terracidiphilus sp.]
MTRFPALRTLLFLICAVFAFTPAAQARFQPTPCKNPYTQQQEIQVGYTAVKQVYQQQPILPDSSPVSQYVRALGAKLVPYAPGYRWPFQFHVVNAADINAFALPGGEIFVNLGTIQAATDEAQLAGVMAHEISHVVQRHSTCNEARQQIPSILAGLGGALAGVFLPGTAGVIAQQGISSVAGLSFLRMSRDDEKQADLMGTDILYDAGYDPRALPQFFETIQAKYGAGGAQLLSDHPNPGNRVGYVKQEIATLPPKPNLMTNSPTFVSMHASAIKLHPATAEEIKAGAWKKSQPPVPAEAAAAPEPPATTTTTAPSGSTPSTPAAQPPAALDPNLRWQPSSAISTFTHTLYTVRYPQNWSVYGNAQSSVTLAPPGGVGTDANGQSATAYGVLIDRYQGQGSLQQQTDALVQSIQQGNPGMAAVTDATALTVNRRPALSVEFIGSSPLATSGKPMPERDWLVTIQRPDGSLSFLVFIAPERNFNALRSAFGKILGSFTLQ